MDDMMGAMLDLGTIRTMSVGEQASKIQHHQAQLMVDMGGGIVPGDAFATAMYRYSKLAYRNGVIALQNLLGSDVPCIQIDAQLWLDFIKKHASVGLGAERSVPSAGWTYSQVVDWVELHEGVVAVVDNLSHLSFIKNT